MVLVVVELFQLALLDTVYEDWDLVGVELTDPLGPFTPVVALHSLNIIMGYFDMQATVLSGMMISENGK